MGKAKGNDSDEVRAVIGPLNWLAADYQITIGGVRHPKKGEDTAEGRVGGAGSWQDVPRDHFEVQIDEMDSEEKPHKKRRYLFNLPGSYKETAPTLGFHIHAPKVNCALEGDPEDWRDGVHIVFEEGTHEIEADDNYERKQVRVKETLDPKSGGDKTEAAKDFIMATLFEGGRYAKELDEMSKVQKIAPRTFERARKELRDSGKIKSDQIVDPKDEKVRWFWTLTEQGRKEWARVRI
jgi:hypothetical protein